VRIGEKAGRRERLGRARSQVGRIVEHATSQAELGVMDLLVGHGPDDREDHREAVAGGGFAAFPFGGHLAQARMRSDDEERIAFDRCLVCWPPARGARRIEDRIWRARCAGPVRLRGDGARLSHGSRTNERLQSLRDERDIGRLGDGTALVAGEQRDATVAVDGEPVGVERPLRETREVHALEGTLRVLAGHRWYLRIVRSGSS
jgi:hypothetical protein